MSRSPPKQVLDVDQLHLQLAFGDHPATTVKLTPLACARARPLAGVVFIGDSENLPDASWLSK